MGNHELTEAQQEALRVFRMSKTLVLEGDDELPKIFLGKPYSENPSEMVKGSEDALLSA